MFKKINNFISNRKPNFYFFSAIFTFLISLFLRIFKAFLFGGGLYTAYPFYFVRPEFLDQFISILTDTINVVGSGLLIYGLSLKITNSFSSRKVQIFEKEGLFNDNLDIFDNHLDTKEIDEEGDETKLLKSYYNQVLRQSDISFTFSLVFAALGFIVIVFSLFSSSNEQLINLQNSQAAGASKAIDIESFNNSKTWASLISGIVIEAVSALFFVQTNNARKTMIEFSDKIRLDRKLTEALVLIEKIKRESIQSKVKALLVLNFSGLNMKYDDQDILKQIIESESDDSEDVSHQEETPHS